MMKKLCLAALLAGALFLTAVPFQMTVHADESSDLLSETSVSKEAETSEEKLEASDPLQIAKNTLPSNLFFYDFSLSGMPLSDAQDFIKAPISNIMNSSYVLHSSIRDDYVFGASAGDLSVTYDLQNASLALDNYVLKGNPLERYIKSKDLQQKPKKISLNIHVDRNAAFSYFNDIANQWKTKPVNATASAISGSLKVVPGKKGYDLDISDGIEKMCSDIQNARIDDSGCYYIQFNESTTDPELTSEHVAQFSIIGSFSTDFYAPTTDTLKSRMNNVQNSASNMNGRTFAAGETVSALNLYGPITEENGYLPAGTFNESAHTLEVGGGICQTTTTLYNAVLMAELDVTYRRNHSMLVTYVDPSRDAMVYAQGGSDFTFVNSTSDYICIDAYVDTSNYSITVNIIGKEEHAPDHSVRYESEILELTAPYVSLEDDPSKKIGWDNVEDKITLAGNDSPTAGVKSRLWKITTDNGVENRTLFTDTDTYKPCSATYHCSPDATCTIETTGPREAGFCTINSRFLDGTPLNANPAEMSEEERSSFNSRMSSLLSAKGYNWPYKGSDSNVQHGSDSGKSENNKEKTEAPPQEEAASEAQ